VLHLQLEPKQSSFVLPHLVQDKKQSLSPLFSESFTNKGLLLFPSLFCHGLSLQNKKSPAKGDFLSTGIPI
jgi:hypothetical protein